MLTSGTTDNNGKAGRTGAPGEQTCVDGCHNSYALNSGAGSIALGSTNMVNWQYVPGATYHMTVTVALATSNLYGFDVECLTASGANAGTLTVTNAAQTQVKNATVNGISRRNIVHQLNGGAGAGSKTFSFDWVAPASDIGNVTFYYAGNASNGNNDKPGDYIYTGSQVITPATGTGIADITWDTGELGVGPNPFRDALTMGYAMPEGGEVVLSLLDLEGRLVERLLASERPPGHHSETVAGLERLGPGTYLLVLDAAGRRTVRKVVRAED